MKKLQVALNIETLLCWSLKIKRNYLFFSLMLSVFTVFKLDFFFFFQGRVKQELGISQKKSQMFEAYSDHVHSEFVPPKHRFKQYERPWSPPTPTRCTPFTLNMNIQPLFSYSERSVAPSAFYFHQRAASARPSHKKLLLNQGFFS